jgi:tetratricopeptide (TPR) repeat protein
MTKPKVWTPEEAEFLRQNYAGMTNAELAAKLNVTQASVRSKLRRLKLVRKPAQAKESATPVTLEQADALYYDQRDYSRAAQEYANAAKKTTDRSILAKALYWQAECKAKLGRLDEARQILTKVIEGCPEHYLAGAAQRRLSALQDA